MKRKEREENGNEAGSSMDVSPQKKRVRFSEENEVRNIPKSVQKMEKMEMGMGAEEEVAMVRDILGVAGSLEMTKKKEELEDFEKEAKEKSKKLFKDDLEDEGDATQIDEKEVVVPLGKASDRFLAKPDEVRMEPFNMKREMDFGSFVGGHYVEKREEKSVEDNWFDGVMENIDSQGEGYFSKARKIELERQKKRAKEDKEEDDEEGGEERIRDLKKKILELLKDGESVSVALRRLAPPKKDRKKRKGGKPVGGDEMMVDNNKEGKEEEFGQGGFDILSSLSAEVYSLGVVDIYEQKKEKIEGEVKGMKWEYKGAGGELHGPYGGEEMEGWKGGGYFVGNYVVEVRKVFVSSSSYLSGGEGEKDVGEWMRSDTVSSF